MTAVCLLVPKGIHLKHMFKVNEGIEPKLNNVNVHSVLCKQEVPMSWNIPCMFRMHP